MLFCCFLVFVSVSWVSRHISLRCCCLVFLLVFPGFQEIDCCVAIYLLFLNVIIGVVQSDFVLLLIFLCSCFMDVAKYGVVLLFGFVFVFHGCREIYWSCDVVLYLCCFVMFGLLLCVAMSLVYLVVVSCCALYGSMSVVFVLYAFVFLFWFLISCFLFSSR